MYNKNLQVKCFVSGGFAIVLRVARFVGLAPLHFIKDKDGWTISTSFAWSLYGYIMIFILSLLTITFLTKELQSHELPWSKTRATVWVVQVGLMMVSAGMSVCMAPGQMKLMSAVLNRVQKINSELNINHWPESLGKKMGSIIVSQLVLCLILSTTDMAANLAYYWNGSIIGANVFYFLCYWILELRNVQFIVIVLHVKYSFKVINDNLKGLLEDLDCKKVSFLNNYVSLLNDTIKTNEPNKGGWAFKSRKHQWTVRCLTQSYAALCGVVREVNQAHGPIVMLLLITYMLQLVCTSYHFISYLTRNHTEQNLPWMLILLFWFLFHTFCLVMTIEPCQSTHMEMAQTRKLVGHLIACTQTITYDPLEIELEKFFWHLLLNEVCYMPLNITKMSRGLVLTILGSLITYTVVIQNI